ncbi:MAG: sugar transferase [Saprospiraceae bacterium]|nr:sugar transferase [Saprospiraceae bacterium]
MKQPLHHFADQTQTTQPNAYRKMLYSEVPAQVVDLIEETVDLDNPWDAAILQTSSPVNLVNFASNRGYGESGLGCITNLKKINDIRFVNKFLESANECLRYGGTLIGCVETAQQRKDRLMAKFPFPLNKVYYFFDFWVKRVWPKLPYFKQLYFFITTGRNRVISEMETYGRLYSCGFRLKKTLNSDGLLYFVAEKTGEPDYNNEASYGPLIKLRRVGKNGRVFGVYKFRTMYPYSEYIQEFVYQHNGLQPGGKIKEDPRVNSAGRFMRKYWLDELPMLWNFLKGDMKLIGVRPLSRHYMSLYPKDFQEYRQRFKPGLIPPVYVEIPETLEDVVAIEGRYLAAYERNPLLTDFRYFCRAFYNIVIKRVRSK